MKNVKHLGQIPDGATLVTADVVGPYPSIPYKALRRRLNGREMSELATENIVQMSEVILKNNIFEFNGEFKRQKSDTAIDTNLHLLKLAFSWIK